MVADACEGVHLEPAGEADQLVLGTAQQESLAFWQLGDVGGCEDALAVGLVARGPQGTVRHGTGGGGAPRPGRR